MEPVATLKRTLSVSFKLCIICQAQRESSEITPTETGLSRLQEATQERKKLRSTKYQDVIDRLESIFEQYPLPQIFWHKSCYSDYTSSWKITRLRDQLSSTAVTSATPSPSGASSSTVPTSCLRSHGTAMNWGQCMFCQLDYPKQKLSEVQVLSTSQRILEYSKYDSVMRIRLACVSDLIAAEGKYHPGCHTAFFRKAITAEKMNLDTHIVMVLLCQELRQAAEKGHMLELTDVWDRYCEISRETGNDIPPSYVSRITTFKAKLSSQIDDYYEVVTMPDRPNGIHSTVLLPIKFRHVPISVMQDNIDGSLTDNIPVYKPEDENEFLAMVHVALKIRGDIRAQQPPNGINISEQSAINIIPDSLYMLLNLMIGGHKLLDMDEEDEEQEGTEESYRRSRITSIAQDLVYAASGDKFLTPKHIGLASCLHQATRSKELVTLFHRAGHIASYRDVLQLDTALARSTLTTMDATGAVVPPNLVEGRFVMFSADNIDINECSLDGKDTFHATQMAVWQRGPSSENLLENIKLSSNTDTLKVPSAMTDIILAQVQEVCEPKFQIDVEEHWFNQTDNDTPSAVTAQAKDMAYIMTRQQQTVKVSWTGYNQEHSNINPEKTSTGFLPIIQAPAHDFDTLSTAVLRAVHIAKILGQQHVVFTVDEALFPKMMTLKYKVPEYRDVLIPRLGGLHTTMNFLGVIGKHMQDSGLAEVWIECDILGPNAAKQAMSGKGYARAIRAHKITLQSLWHLLLPLLHAHLQETDRQLAEELQISVSQTNDDLVTNLETTRFRDQLSLFIAHLTQENQTVKFWWQYMEMVGIMQMFVRAQRDGIWDLHIHAFRRMLPYFYRYDHYHYARWGTVYLAEMMQLPPEVLREFQAGNFVVKHSDRPFNQVDPDHSTEWLNATGKKSGGIVGITRKSTALNKWALSFNLRALISTQTKHMFNVHNEEAYIHSEMTPSRMKKETAREEKLTACLRSLNMFNLELMSCDLHNIVTKEIATTSIQTSLLCAESLGKEQLITFVKLRMLPAVEGQKHIDIKAPIKLNKPLTFASLYVVDSAVKGKEKVVDRNMMQRLITAYRAGRPVDLDAILSHELMPVPLSLATIDRNIRTGTKSDLTNLLITNLTVPANVPLNGQSCLIIDGQALVMSLGGKHGNRTFGEFAETFTMAVFNMGSNFNRIDITFDRYLDVSIKDTTRHKRTRGTRPVRRVIENDSVPLPGDWTNYMALGENKADLANFLSAKLILLAPEGKIVVVAGGFLDIMAAQSSSAHLDITSLSANHEEADTRLIVHCIHAQADTIVVSARDTDVLILLLAHFSKMSCTQLWMKSGTRKAPKYIPVHELHTITPTSQVNTLLAFHAITGCDSVSYFAGHGKRTAFKVFELHHDLLENLGDSELSATTVQAAEKFICKIYKLVDISTCDKARTVMFCKGHLLEALPPTSNAAHLHIRRAHYQTMVWRQAGLSIQQLPLATDMGWQMADGHLVPQLMSLPPIPKACEIVACGCASDCLTKRCSCRKIDLTCTEACKCINAVCLNVTD